MKVVSTEALTKLIQLVKSAFIKVDDVVEVTEIETETSGEITLATVATSGSYNDLLNKPDLSTKADVDLSNINTNGKSFVSGLGMPSSRYIDLTIGASDTTYTAPANGYFYIECRGTSTTYFGVSIHNQATGIASGCALPQNYTTGYFYIAAKEGDVCLLYYQSNISITTFKFIYAKGEN